MSKSGKTQLSRVGSSDSAGFTAGSVDLVLCSHCDRGAPVKSRHLCSACYEHRRRHQLPMPAKAKPGIKLCSACGSTKGYWTGLCKKCYDRKHDKVRVRPTVSGLTIGQRVTDGLLVGTVKPSGASKNQTCYRIDGGLVTLVKLEKTGNVVGLPTKTLRAV